jgi:hypothetical protein
VKLLVFEDTEAPRQTMTTLPNSRRNVVNLK